MAGVVHIPWYATTFRGDKLAAALAEVAAPAALRYGATQYAIHRSRDDTYRILHMIWFESKLDWERYWDGPEMSAFRAQHSGWYQIPVLYAWNDEVARDLVTLAEPTPATEHHSAA
jgi:hypothetical protein